MKSKIGILIGVLSLLSLLSSCKKEFDTAGSIAQDLDNVKVTHTIAELKQMYEPGGRDIFTNVVIAGIVNSDDSEGNLYRSIAIQDETGGIELKMGMGNMNLIYKQGRRVLVKCQGLRLGKNYGIVNLGYKSADPKYETGFVPEKMVTRVMIPGLPAPLHPKKLSIAEMKSEYAFTLVQVDDVQFLENELGKTWADPENKQKTGYVERTLRDRTGNRLIVRTSSYARFAGHKLPEGNGSAVGLLSFFNDTPQLIVIHPSDFNFQGKRFAE
ncbi:DUF5689 domain-containing protein [Porphyromonas crevioricanis]|nr:DUF5689 domain-containing protein [Porphyromonas crevioricanis]GAD05322.1 hypothetical protein PORCRE_1022 [Porphyromonas crevioricanis JCM 15906]GAD08227.1 hypothetical protein PORCAN_1863 [Porphyromonas crevioricanis JCM 13913]SJZ86793.1 hypothetical protein SAMN02745203_01101 [Porphyromonas crevioricanis]SQH73187.1 Uncharacterised protein [Porphyromonas crevioricanis]